MMITDRNGRDNAVMWLRDHRGAYGLLIVDAQTGEAHQYNFPFDASPDQNVEAAHLSTDNKLYTLVNSHFIEFDLNTRKYSQVKKVSSEGLMAMSIAEDNQKRVWLVTYPRNELFSYSSSEGLKDRGTPTPASETWDHYPRTIAADDSGWVYFGSGVKQSQIYAYNPTNNQFITMLPENQRTAQSSGEIVRSGNTVYARNNGKVYTALRGVLTSSTASMPKGPVIGTYGTIIYTAPSGRSFSSINMIAGRLTTTLNGKTETVSFKHSAEGGRLMMLCVTPQNLLCGSTRDPIITFLFNPQTKASIPLAPPENYRDEPQPNIVTALGTNIFVGAYPDGRLLSYDKNGKFTERFSSEQVYRPHALVNHSSGISLLAGHSGYGTSGGGMVIERTVNNALKHTVYAQDKVIPHEAVQSMIELKDGQVIAGTTTAPNSGGVKEDTDGATLFGVNLADDNSSRVLWRVSLPNVGGEQPEALTDMVQAADGTVYIVANSTMLYAFDPIKRSVKWSMRLTAALGSGSTAIHNPQSTRALVRATNSFTNKEGVYLLLNNQKIAKVNEEGKTLEIVAESPVPISVGGVHLNGRIYFGSNAQVYSWQVEK